jgi:hypothetical protein
MLLRKKMNKVIFLVNLTVLEINQCPDRIALINFHREVIIRKTYLMVVSVMPLQELLNLL